MHKSLVLKLPKCNNDGYERVAYSITGIYIRSMDRDGVDEFRQVACSSRTQDGLASIGLKKKRLKSHNSCV